MQAIMGLVLIGLCVVLVRLARPRADGTVPAAFQNEAAATGAILALTVFGSFGLLLILFQLTGIGAA